MACRLRSQRGATIVDYLMITALVAGVAVPLVIRFFGEPIMRTFTSERKTLVDFLAQNPKRPVPNLWFKGERPADVPEPGDPGNPKDLPDPDIPPLGELPETKNLPEPRVPAPGDVPAGDLPPPGDLPEVGGVGGGGRGAGGGTGGGGGDGLSSDFFSPPDKKDAGRPGTEPTDSAKRGGGLGVSDPAGEPTGQGRGGDATTRKGEKEFVDAQKERTSGQTKRYQNDLIAQIEEKDRAKAGKFDWWLLIKILVLLLIILLAILIGLSNLRRR